MKFVRIIDPTAAPGVLSDPDVVAVSDAIFASLPTAEEGVTYEELTAVPGSDGVIYGSNDFNTDPAYQPLLIFGQNLGTGHEGGDTADHAGLIYGYGDDATYRGIGGRFVGVDPASTGNAGIVGWDAYGDPNNFQYAQVWVTCRDGAADVSRVLLDAAQMYATVMVQTVAAQTLAALNINGGGFIQWAGEISDPAAAPSNGARLYARDNGSGKTQLCARFASGAVQVLATEP